MWCIGHNRSFQTAVRLLDTIPGGDQQLAILIVAEICVDMSRFPSDRHLTAWAGVAPGNNQTGGQQRSGKTPQRQQVPATWLGAGRAWRGA